jgi:hypothetical protein
MAGSEKRRQITQAPDLSQGSDNAKTLDMHKSVAQAV